MARKITVTEADGTVRRIDIADVKSGTELYADSVKAESKRSKMSAARLKKAARDAFGKNIQDVNADPSKALEDLIYDIEQNPGDRDGRDLDYLLTPLRDALESLNGGDLEQAVDSLEGALTEAYENFPTVTQEINSIQSTIESMIKIDNHDDSQIDRSMTTNTKADEEGETLSDAEWQTILANAATAGAEAGKNAASWWIDGNSSDEDKERLRQGIEDGDPEIMDQLPYLDLSGQWADGPSEEDVLNDIPGNFDVESLSDDEKQELISAYEDAYNSAVQDEAGKSKQVETKSADVSTKGIESIAPLASQVDDILGELERDASVRDNEFLMDEIGTVNSGDLQGGNVIGYLQTLNRLIDSLDKEGIDTSELSDLYNQIVDVSDSDKSVSVSTKSHAPDLIDALNGIVDTIADCTPNQEQDAINQIISELETNGIPEGTGGDISSKLVDASQGLMDLLDGSFSLAEGDEDVKNTIQSAAQSLLDLADSVEESPAEEMANEFETEYDSHEPETKALDPSDLETLAYQLQSVAADATFETDGSKISEDTQATLTSVVSSIDDGAYNNALTYLESMLEDPLPTDVTAAANELYSALNDYLAGGHSEDGFDSDADSVAE